MRGSVTMALSYNQVSKWLCILTSFLSSPSQRYRLIVLCYLQLQFSKPRTVSDGALIITSTITVVLFSTVVGLCIL